jgi:hypothetical protein
MNSLRREIAGRMFTVYFRFLRATASIQAIWA